MARQIEAGKAVVSVEANRSRLAAGLAAAQKQLGTFAKGAARLGRTAGVGIAGLIVPLIATARSFKNAGGELDDMSQRTGASVEALSGLGYAAQMSGSSINDIEKGIRTMQREIAAGGPVIAKLGIDLEDLKTKSPDEQFKTIADQIAKIEDPALKSSMAMEVFGKSGADLVPLLSGGSDGINDLAKQGEALGAVMSGKQAQSAAILGDSVDMVTTSFKGLINTIGAKMAPAITAYLAGVTYSINLLRKWIAELELLAGPVWQGVMNAMSSGDFAMAAEIMFDQLNIVFVESTIGMAVLWDEWLNGLLGAVDQFIATFRSKWNDVNGWLADRMLEAYGQFDGTFDAEMAKQTRAEDTQRQNKSFAAGAANRAAGRSTAAEAKNAARTLQLQQAQGALAYNLARAAEAAEKAAMKPPPETVNAPEIEELIVEAEGVSSDSVEKGSRDVGTFSGFAAAMLGQGGRSVDLDILAESKQQSALLGKVLAELQNQKGAAFA
jgi:hypothetical protein